MEKNIHLVMTIRLFGENKCFGPGIAQLLHRVEEMHSLRAAAISMDMAYSKAWKIMRAAQQTLGFSLLESTTGGKNGGGAVLTQQAKNLLTAYDSYCREMKEFGEKLFQERFDQLL